jgi:hypothetical protein
MKTTTNIIYPAFALFAFACFALSPRAQAACQDGCLANQNTVQGDDALISVTTGTNLKKQSALIQKVNDKLELNKSAPQTVLNKQP